MLGVVNDNDLDAAPFEAKDENEATPNDEQGNREGTLDMLCLAIAEQEQQNDALKVYNAKLRRKWRKLADDLKSYERERSIIKGRPWF